MSTSVSIILSAWSGNTWSHFFNQCHCTRHFKHRALIFWLWNGDDSQSATKFEQQWILWSVRCCSCKVHNSAGRLTTSTECIQCSCHDCSSCQSTILRLQMPWIKKCQLKNASMFGWQTTAMQNDPQCATDFEQQWNIVQCEIVLLQSAWVSWKVDNKQGTHSIQLSRLQQLSKHNVKMSNALNKKMST